MKVSIGIPCYKQSEFLPDAIESALNQTVSCEIIVINDGSPDYTKEIAEKYPVKLINQVNKGLSCARNTAIMNMTGDYFLPLDADDILKENCVEKIINKYQETNADIIAPSFKCFGVGDSEIILMKNPTIEDFKVANRIGYFSAIRKSALLECGGYSPRMQQGWEDMHLWFDLLSRGKKISVIQESLVLYRTKEQSMWKDALKYSDELSAQIKKDFPQFYES